MFACSAGQQDIGLVVSDPLYAFEISVNKPGAVEVGHAKHDLRELKVIKDRKVEISEETASGPTSSERFTFGLDPVRSRSASGNLPTSFLLWEFLSPSVLASPTGHELKYPCKTAWKLSNDELSGGSQPNYLEHVPRICTDRLGHRHIAGLEVG